MADKNLKDTEAYRSLDDEGKKYVDSMVENGAGGQTVFSFIAQYNQTKDGGKTKIRGKNTKELDREGLLKQFGFQKTDAGENVLPKDKFNIQRKENAAKAAEIQRVMRQRNSFKSLDDPLSNLLGLTKNTERSVEERARRSGEDDEIKRQITKNDRATDAEAVKAAGDKSLGQEHAIGTGNTKMWQHPEFRRAFDNAWQNALRATAAGSGLSPTNVRDAKTIHNAASQVLERIQYMNDHPMPASELPKNERVTNTERGFYDAVDGSDLTQVQNKDGTPMVDAYGHPVFTDENGNLVTRGADSNYTNGASVYDPTQKQTSIDSITGEPIAGGVRKLEKGQISFGNGPAMDASDLANMIRANNTAQETRRNEYVKQNREHLLPQVAAIVQQGQYGGAKPITEEQGRTNAGFFARVNARRGPHSVSATPLGVAQQAEMAGKVAEANYEPPPVVPKKAVPIVAGSTKVPGAVPVAPNGAPQDEDDKEPEKPGATAPV